MFALGKKPIINPKSGLMYVFKTTKKGKYKVGATGNFGKRSKKHNCPQAEDLELAFIYEVKDKKRVDACVKNKLKPWLARDDREIYKINLSEIKEIIIDCNEEINFYSKENKEIKTDELDELEEIITNKHDLKRINSDEEEYFLIISDKNIDDIKNIVVSMVNEECKNQNDYYYKKYKKYKTKYYNIKKSNE